MIVTVTPNASLDLTYELPAGAAGRLQPGADHVHRADSATLEASGKGVNVSRALVRAGHRSIAVLAAGGVTGEHLLSLLAADGVAYRHAEQSGPTRINTTVLGDATITKINGPGSAPTPAEVDHLVATVAATLADALAGSRSGTPATNGSRPQIWLAVCGSFPPATDVGLMARLVMTARSAGIRCAVDSSGIALASALSAGADLLAPNLAELAQIRPVLWPILGLSDQVQRAQAVRDQITQIAAAEGCQFLVSLGADGAIWTDGTTTVQVSAEPVIPINTAGAGDALLAGWLSGTDQQDTAERLRLAVSWGTAACLSATTVAGPAP